MTLLILAILSSVWANGFQADPLTTITDAQARDNLLRAQVQALGSRVRQSSDCGVILAPLPGPNGSSVEFARSFSLIDATLTAIKTEMPRSCQLQLAQNLQLTGGPGVRLSNELIRYNSPQLGSDTVFSCAPSASPIQELLGLLQNFRSATACNEIRRGEWTVVNKSAAFYDNISYALTRENDDSYRAVLSLNFTDLGTGANSPEMMAKVRQCLNGAAPFLNGPVRGQSGEDYRLKIDVISWEEAERLPLAARPRRNSIRVAPPGSANNVRNYAQDIGCDTIIHEVMHLMGLCDEYPGERDGYPCRPVGRPSSLMRNESVAFSESVPQQMTCACNTPQCAFIATNQRRLAYALQPGLRDFAQNDFLNRNCSSPQGPPLQRPIDTEISEGESRFATRRLAPSRLEITFAEIQDAPLMNSANVVTEKRICQCQSGDTECEAMLNRLDNVEERRSRRPSTIICPGGSQPLRAVVANRPFTSGVRNTSQGRTIELYSKPNRDSMLEPWHFNQIINGNCPRKTNFYDTCAQLSYQRNPQRCQAVLSEDNGSNAVCLDRYNWGDYQNQLNEVARCRDNAVGNTRFVQCQADREL